MNTHKHFCFSSVCHLCLLPSCISHPWYLLNCTGKLCSHTAIVVADVVQQTWCSGSGRLSLDISDWGQPDGPRVPVGWPVPHHHSLHHLWVASETVILLCRGRKREFFCVWCMCVRSCMRECVCVQVCLQCMCACMHAWSSSVCVFLFVCLCVLVVLGVVFDPYA